MQREFPSEIPFVLNAKGKKLALPQNASAIFCFNENVDESLQLERFSRQKLNVLVNLIAELIILF